MQPIKTVKKFLNNASTSAQLSAEIREGVANQSTLLNRKLNEIISLLRQQNELLARGQGLSGKQKMTDSLQSPPLKIVESFEEAMQQHPLIFAPKTFNTSHPDYDATEARNFPGKIFNIDKNLENPTYNELRKLISNSEIPEHAWSAILEETLKEVKTVPHADQVFERKAFVEKYMAELEKQYPCFA